jgi:hypothetical protein
MGCHEEANGLSLGQGVVAPSSNGFVQVTEQFTEDCGDGSQCFAASQALKDVFLPRRLRAMNDLMNSGSCSSADGGAVVDAGSPGTPADAGAPVDGGASADGGAFVSTMAPSTFGARRGRTTLGGQPASVTH